MVRWSKANGESESDSNQISLEEIMENSTSIIPVKSEPERLTLLEPSQIKEINPDKSFDFPENVRKNHSKLFNELVYSPKTENEFEIEVPNAVEVLEIDEIALNKFPVTSKVSLTYNEDVVVGTLTVFDKEVIDAVATLAPHANVITATDIFRVITGKLKGSVTKEQREKVNKSMIKCRQYTVNIDLTSEYIVLAPHEKGNVTSLTFAGSLISFNNITKKARNGTNFSYQIYDIPPLFKVAEVMGKISVFPFELLDTPISKTDQVITIQSYLLREIDLIKNQSRDSNYISWNEIFDIAGVNSTDTRYMKPRVKTTVNKILTHWKEKGFISDYKNKKIRKADAILIE